MGANGSFSVLFVPQELFGRWKIIYILKNRTKVIELKNKSASVKMPELSQCPNSTYAIFRKDGSGVKAITRYGGDRKKLYEIHTTEHHGMRLHVHYWKDGKPMGKEPDKLTPAMWKLFRNVSGLKQHVKR